MEGEGNLIADNWNGVGAGVIIAYADAAGNVVAGNGIGVNKDGGPLGNWSDGVAVVLDAHHNNIGGTAGVAPTGPCQGACNLIAANLRHGIHMGPFAVQELPAPPQATGRPAPASVFLRPDPDGVPSAPSAVTGNLVRGNFIGTEEWGTVDQGNVGHGISLEGAADNTIGGPTAAERNLISGNDGSGIVLSGSGATGNKVQGNRIGTDVGGTANLGNTLEGVSIEAGASDNTIGGTTTAEGNIIAFSGRNGVQVLDGVGNAILGNPIHSSSLLGIDLGGDGITPNDPDDSDDGPNNLQNFPLFTHIVPQGTTQIAVTGILSSTPGARFRLEFFADTGYKQGGGVEGKDLLGSTEVDVGGSGRGEFNVTLPDQGDVLTANATRLDGNGQPVETSEFTPVDVAIIGVEVTQAIQDLGNSVELVNQKPTFALVHARALGPFQIADIRAQLTGWRDGVPLGTITAQPETVTLRRVPRRSFYDHSFHFQLPAQWTAGTELKVEAEINYAPRTLAEADYVNNKKTVTAQFSRESWLRVRLYRVAWYSIPSGTWHTALNRTATGIERTLNAIYPTPHVYTERYKLVRYGLSPIDVIARLQINDELTSVRAWDRLWGKVDADVVYLGIIPDVSGGLASPLVYVASVGEQGSDEWIWKNAAHEIGHVFGRSHTCTPSGGESWCDGSYPYPDGEISWRPSGGPLTEYAPTIAFGYDRMASNPLHTNTTSDLMSYGIPTRWISDYTWNGIRAFISLADAPTVSPLQPPGEYLVFSGRISLTQEAVTLYTFYRVPDLPAQPLPISGTCTLRLLDAGGGELAAYSFAAESNPHIEPGEEPVASFAEAVPYVTGTARIEVVSGTQVLATRLVSSATPMVTWAYPQGGEQLTGTVVISWTAQDADAEPLTATLFYSADDGGTWSVLALEWPSTTLPLDTVALPGSDQARLRVLVSDGVNTGQATSPTFTVELKPPHPTITLPLAGQVYAPGEPVNLIGAAWDPEDGTLTGTALLWTDSVSGTLGSGEELLVPSLAPGRHTLTLTATDGDGMTGTASVEIRVGYYEVALPVVFRDWPSQVPSWHLEYADAPRAFDNFMPRAMALDSAGHPHVVYGEDHLYHAWNDGGGWQVEVVDASPQVGQWAAIALDSNDRPHISYNSSEGLKYAHWDGAQWQIEVVNGGGVYVGWDTSIAIDAKDRPHISYRLSALADSELRHAYWDGTAWQITSLEIVGYGGYNSVAVDSLDRSHISYSVYGSGAEPHRLKHAYWDGTQWQIEVVDTVSYVGANSLALDDSDYGHIAYYAAEQDGYLNYAYWDGTGWQTETVAAAGNALEGISLALDGAGQPHFSYYDGAAGILELRYTYWDGATWQTQVVEGGLATTAGEATSLALDGAGNPQISYYFKALLKHARWDGAAWQISTIDQPGEAGYYASLALDGNLSAGQARPHIGSYDQIREQIRYAWWNGSAWQLETVASDVGFGSYGLATSLALDSLGRPHMSYRIDTPDSLMYAHHDGTAWQVETVDAGFRLGECNTLALDSLGRPHIAYYEFYFDPDPDILKHAWWDGAQWQIATVDQAWALEPGTIGLALDGNDHPHIAYRDEGSQVLRYAHWDGAAWIVETVDASGNVGHYPSLALDSADRPHISYYDSTNTALRYARWDGAAWQVEMVDSAGYVGYFTSLALDTDDRPHISYYDDSTDVLKYTWWDGAVWQVETVDDTGAAGWFTSLALDAYGFPHIAYYDLYNRDLKYAWWGW